MLIALDGTEHFCSRKIHCERCSTRRRSDGGTEYFHAFLGASMVAPGHTRVLPLPPEFVAPQDGAEKQDCERNAAKRWLTRHGPAVAHLRPVYLGDDLFACQPIAEAIHRVGGGFILTCKPASHQTVSEYLHGATLEEHRQAEFVRGKRTTTIYRWLSQVPLRPPMTHSPLPGSPSKFTTPKVNGLITTASSPIWTSMPATSPKSPRVAVRAGRSRVCRRRTRKGVRNELMDRVHKLRGR
jgi:hypothetical protein